MFTYILKRLTERSTWLGLIALATACGVELETAFAEQIIAAGVALAGLVGILTRDNKDEDKTTESEAEAGKEDQDG